jgi:hypothetical protein
VIPSSRSYSTKPTRLPWPSCRSELAICWTLNASPRGRPKPRDRRRLLDEAAATLHLNAAASRYRQQHRTDELRRAGVDRLFPGSVQSSRFQAIGSSILHPHSPLRISSAVSRLRASSSAAGLTVVLSHSGWSLAMSHTKAEKTFTELILEIFQFNGRLLAAGDRRAKRLGLTSYAGRCSARSRNAPAGGPDRLQHATGAAKRTAAHGRTAGRGIRRVHPGS